LFLLMLAALLVGLLGAVMRFGDETVTLSGNSIPGGRFLLISAPALLLALVSVFFLLVAWGYEDPYEKARRELSPGDRKYPLVSFLVAVRNDEHLIVDCINSLLAQTYPNREIFIVNDASDDQTAKILAREFGDNSEVNVITLAVNVGKKRALAKALVRAQGEVLAFTDSDSTWKQDAIERVVAIFENEPDVGAVSGHCNACNADTNILTRLQDSWNQKQYRLRKGFESVFGAVSCVSGPLACYRRAAIYNYIPAWENDRFLGKQFRFATDRTLTGFVLGGARLGPGLKRKYSDSPFIENEDYLPRNWETVYSRSARAWTMVPETRRDLVIQRVRWGKSFIRNLFLTGRFYWHQPLLPALYFYLNVLYLFLLPVILAAIPVYLLLEGGWFILVLYLTAFGLLGMISGLVSRIRNEQFARWLGRPVIGLFALLTLPWLLLYSAVTIRKMTWQRNDRVVS